MSRSLGKIYLEAGAAAALFGATPPLVKRLEPSLPPLLLAGLLYLGAGSVLLSISAATRSREAPIVRSDARLLGLVSAVALTGQVLLVWGIAHLSALAASLLLNLETVFTVGLAALLFGEGLSRRVAMAIFTIVVGAMLVSITPSSGSGGFLGAAAIALACLAWGIDNNLTRHLSGKRPEMIVGLKGLFAGTPLCAVALLSGARAQTGTAVVGALLVGALCYGLSLMLYVRALRALGTARTGAIFAAAPFVGSVIAVLLGDRFGWLLPTGGAVMAVGVTLLVTERHGHPHAHEALEHAHVHVHDEHHQHAHDGHEGPEPHAHLHRHEPMMHEHPHVPDLHHRHKH